MKFSNFIVNRASHRLLVILLFFSKKWKRYKIKGELSVDLTINLIVLNSKFKFKYLI